MRPGDVVYDCEHRAVGVVARVLMPTSGSRAVLDLAWSPDQSVVIAGSDVEISTTVSGTAHQRHDLRITHAAVVGAGVYRRVFGRLSPDPLGPSGHAPPVTTDDVLAALIMEALATDPLTEQEDLHVTVADGLAVVTGRCGTDAGVVQASRAARATPGIWHALSIVVSDEAIATDIRRLIRADEAVARAIAHLAVVRGHATATVTTAPIDHTVVRHAWIVGAPGLLDVQFRSP